MKCQTLQELIDAHEKIFKGKAPISWSIDPKGWGPLVHQLCRDIQKELTDEELEKFTVTQIKEKFGALRFYVDNVPPQKSGQINLLILKAEKKSSEICQRCGAPAETKSHGFWVFTLCKACLKNNQIGI